VTAWRLHVGRQLPGEAPLRDTRRVAFLPAPRNTTVFMQTRSALVFLASSVLTFSPTAGQTLGQGSPESPPSWVTSGPDLQDGPWSEGIVGTGLLLRRLDGVKRVLMIGAHPDDEDTALLAALARGMGVETAYLSLTRGEGGQNLIGPELDEGLGLVRTGELLAARALDGGRQYFTRAFDFGYSKTAEETFRFWPKDEVLADVTWVVRTFRPQVIISVFSGTPADGHGHHQVAGILAYEVFDVANDPTRYPDQLAAGVGPWAPTKLYRLTRRNPEDGTAGVETGAFDALLGRSYYQVAMESRSQHRSQDMGVAQPMGPRRSTVGLVKSRAETAGPDEIFSGIDTSLVVLGENLPGASGGRVASALRIYRAAVLDAVASLSVSEPWSAAPPLGRALQALESGIEALNSLVTQGGGGEEAADLLFFLRERLPLVQRAFLRAAGILTDVRVDEEFLVAGEEAGITLELWNGGPFVIHTASGEPVGPSGWSFSGREGSPQDLQPGSTIRYSFQVRVPMDAEPSSLYYLREPRDGELYRWPMDRKAWGSPGDEDLMYGHLAFDVGGLGEVAIWAPARYRGVNKATGEFVEPVLVVPALDLHLDPPILVWPSDDQGAKEFTLSVQSRGKKGLEGVATLEVPAGWKVEPRNIPLSLPEVGAEASFTFHVTRPEVSPDGRFSVTARVQTADGRVFRSGVHLVDYPHIRRSPLFVDATSNLSIFPLSVPEGLRVGYIMGSGDDGPEAIRQMGVNVKLLGPEELRTGDLATFDVLVLGIRAYETRPDLAAANDRILDFARNGGTVVVQYNKYEYPAGGFAPYPVDMARPHDRVTDEEAPVRILDPANAVFRWPNTLGPGDFDGWVQERGLYFLHSWSPEYTPLLEMADPGEGPERGGLLVARLGKGVYVYTGLAFFRQFPEGVPGAYRLFANLISLRAGDLR